MKNIYVGNLSYESTEEGLKNLFAGFGEVSLVKVVKDSHSNRSKGFAFVEMDDQGAEQAVTALNGTEFDGRTLRVAEAKAKEPREPGSGGGMRRGRPGGGGGYPPRGGRDRRGGPMGGRPGGHSGGGGRFGGPRNGNR